MTTKTLIKALVLTSTGLLVLMVLLGFSGDFFAPGDSLAIVRPQAGALLVLLATALWWTRKPRAALTALGVALLALLTVVPGFFTPNTPCAKGCLTLYQKNLLSKAWPRYPLAEDIIASGAQIVTLQEVSAHNRRFMARLFDHYPLTVRCRFRPSQDVAVLTSLPQIEGTQFCLDNTGLAGVQVVTPTGTPLWIISIHQEWPFPRDQLQQSKRVADHIAGLEGAILIAGDFNMVPWGASVNRIKKAAQAQHLGPFKNTYLSKLSFLPLPIDRILVPKGTQGSIELRGYMGSDHRGVLAHIALP